MKYQKFGWLKFEQYFLSLDFDLHKSLVLQKISILELNPL